MATTMATAQQFLDKANSQLGVSEDPPHSNKNKFTAWYGMVGAWCAMFQSWCFHEVGMGQIKTAWCNDFITNGQNGKWGSWINQYDAIRPGDLAIFDWDGGNADHVAAVNRVFGNGQWESIEGNWGDKVCRIVRGRENIRGFFRPNYSDVPSPPLTGIVSTSSSIAVYQRQLNVILKSIKQPTIAVDGIAGPSTSNAVRIFQNYANSMYELAKNPKRIAVDGIYGPVTQSLLSWWSVAISNPAPAHLTVPSGTPNLSTSSPSSDRIRQLQTAFNRVLSCGLAVDGEYGTKTKNVVIMYQKSRGLTSDGVYGPVTEAKLRAEPAI